MNTTFYDENKNLECAEAYYTHMLNKNFGAMAEYLHSDVNFIGPLAEMSGKDAVVAAAKHFGEILQDIQIRSRFAAGNQIMLAYDMTLPAPTGKFRAAVLMDFKNGQISKIELFYDARPFEAQRDQIFATDTN